MRIRGKGQAVSVHRRTKLLAKGAIDVKGDLDLGAQWPGSPFYRSGYLHVAPGGSLEVTGSFRFFTGLQVDVDKGASLVLGSGYMNSDARIFCFNSVTIGEDVAIAEEVMIRDSDNHEVSGRPHPSAPIVIEDHVWIGMRCTILKGVTIGSGSIIAAGSVVTRDVPPTSLAAGVPATVRRSGVDWQ